MHRPPGSAPFFLPLVLLVIAMLTPESIQAASGKWMPEQILEHDPNWLKELGLEMEARELWDPDSGRGLLTAIVQLNGCSSGFVSAEGLLLTNQHCAFGMQQEHSTPERDLMTHGFLARRHGEELHGTGVRATVPNRFTDVTAEILKAIPEGADDRERFRAIDRKKKELVVRCEEQPFRSCRVATYDDGARYVLIEALEFRDVRLVYVPPRMVGDFGGEIDNWSWPRHSGDFAVLRVYADGNNQPAEHASENRPYRPERWLQVASEGVDSGDFVMVVGYPFRTYRALVAEEMAERAELYFPQLSALYRDWLAIMEAASDADPETAIRLASRIRGLHNREKNGRGQITGLERGDLLAKKRRLEETILAWAEKNKAHRGAVAAYHELTTRAAKARQSTWHGDFLLQQIGRGSGPLDISLASDLVIWAEERQKPDFERLEDYQERHRESLLARQKLQQKRLHLPTEKKLLTDVLTRIASLPEGKTLPSMKPWLGDGSPEAVKRAVDKLYPGSQVHDLEARLAMFDESVEMLRKRQDPMLDLAFALVHDWRETVDREEQHDGAVSRLRPVWRRAVEAYLDRPLDPDANGTLRVSLAHVEGYRPRDAVFMEPMTRLRGLVEKHTGEYPFNAPEKVLAAAPEAAKSRWASATLQDVPIGFLATGDTTGGSSGSPVLNGRGELVGLNFDRVWENIANDFGYNPDIARNISVDIRYLLFMLEDIEDATELLTELGLAR